MTLEPSGNRNLPGMNLLSNLAPRTVRKSSVIFEKFRVRSQNCRNLWSVGARDNVEKVSRVLAHPVSFQPHWFTQQKLKTNWKLVKLKMLDFAAPFLLFEGILGSASGAEFPASLSNHVGFMPLLYSSTHHHSPESIIDLRTGWAQDTWLQWLYENWYLHLDMSRWFPLPPFFSILPWVSF